MSFDNPRLLFALLLLIPTVLTGLFHYRKRRAALGLLSGEGAASRVRFRYVVSALGFRVFLACLIIALAQPRGGSYPVSETRRGADLVFALDLSRSMDVRDAEGPSRLERAATLVAELINHPRLGAGTGGRNPGAPGMRFGAAIGKGRGILALPLTEDTEAMDGFLSSLSGSSITGRGTNLESLVDAAAAAFQDAFPSRRRIILLSDGEALEGALNAAADRAAAADITLIAVGLGSGEGGLVPPASGGSLEDRSVVSSLRIEPLKEAAERTGGFYLDGNRGIAADRLAEYLSASGGVREAATGGIRLEQRSLAHIFIIAALIALGIAKIMEKGRRRGG